MDMKIMFFIGLLVGTAMLFGCAPVDDGSGVDHYGYGGVQTRLTQYPDRMYVYLDENGNTFEDNVFDVGVELTNTGASISYTGVFLSGFDPHILEVTYVDNDGTMISGEQVQPGRFLGQGNCGFNLGSLAGGLSGILDCGFGWGDLTLGYGSGGGTVGTEFNLGGLFDAIGINTGSWGDVFDLIGGSMMYSDDGFSFSLGSVNMLARNYIPGASMLPFISSLSGQAFGDFSMLGGVPQLMRGNTRDYPGGDRKYINYQFKVKNWNSVTDRMTQSMMLTTCYTYSTFASPAVCIDPDPNAANVDKLCDASAPITLSGGQGGPIEITRIVPHPGGKRTYFDIYFRHNGNGRVYEVGKIGMCSPFNPERVSERMLDVVFPAIVGITGNNGLEFLDCNPPGLVRLRDGEGMVTCRYDYTLAGGTLDPAILASRNGYKTPMIIELWYGYSQSERFDIDFYRG